MGKKTLEWIQEIEANKPPKPRDKDAGDMLTQFAIGIGVLGVVFFVVARLIQVFGG